MTNEERFITFSLGKEEYGISIGKVKEIIEMLDITPVPKAPDFVKGIINLRGKLIPVISLRQRFAMDAIDYDKGTCILVVDTEQKGVQKPLGIIVDSVSEVITLEKDQIKPAPSYNTGDIKNKYIPLIGKFKDKAIMLLKVDYIFFNEGNGAMVEGNGLG